jgi:hypothetical protein
LYNGLDKAFDRADLPRAPQRRLNVGVTGAKRAGRAAATRAGPADGEDLALRAALEDRLGALRAAAQRLSSVGSGELAREAARLLARIDAQQNDWIATAPGLVGGRRPADAGRLSRHREHQRALRKLAVLRADVLHAARAAR